MFVNAIMYFKVANAIHAVANVDDYSGSARLLAATTLRNVLGTLTLGDILCQRESLAKEMKVREHDVVVPLCVFRYEQLLILSCLPHSPTRISSSLQKIR